MSPARGRMRLVLVAIGFLGCGEKNVIVFVRPVSASTGPSTGVSASSADVTSGVGGAGGGSGGSGGGGASDAATSQDASSIPCPVGSTPTHAVDTLADALAATSTHLYWLDAASQTVMRQSKLTGASEKLSDMDSRGRFIRVDDSRIFWDEEDPDGHMIVYSMPIDGSTGHVRLASRVVTWAVGIDRVFFWKPGTFFDGGGTNGQIDAVPKAGGIPTVVVTDVLAPAMGLQAADQTGLYWYDGPQNFGLAFKKFTFATNAQTRFNDSKSVSFLLADGGHVLWVDEDGVNGPTDVRWSPPAGAPVLTIASGQRYVRGLDADATTAYWLTLGPSGQMGPGDVVAAPFEGGPLRKLACNIDMPIDMAVDDEAVYVSTIRSVVWKIPKNRP